MRDRVPPLEGPTDDVELGHKPVHGDGSLDQRVDASGILLASNEPPSGGRQALQEDLSLTEEVEKIKNEDKVFYKLGRHSKAFRDGKKHGPEEDAHLETVKARTPGTGKALRLYGYVDATKFQEIYYSNAFYNKYIKAANEIRACFQLLDKETQEWYKNLGDLIDEFADMGSFDRKKWAEIKKNKNYLDKGAGINKIYAKDGLFNFLLSWKRVVNIQPGLAEASKSDFNIGTLGLRDGSISLRFSDKVKSQKHRFAAKVEEEVPVVVQAPGVMPVVPVGPGGGVTGRPDGTIDKIPDRGTVDKIPDPAGGTVDKIPDPAGGTVDKIPYPAGGTVDKVPDPAGGTVDKIPDPAGGTVDKIPDPTDGTIDKVPTTPGGTVDKIPDPTGGTVDKVPDPAGGTVDKIPTPPGGTIDKIPDPAGGTVDKIPDPSGGTVDKIPTPPGGTVDKVTTPPSGTVDKVPNTPGGTIDKIPDPAGGTVDKVPTTPGGTVDKIPE